jgi:hypothetical protein
MRMLRQPGFSDDRLRQRLTSPAAHFFRSRESAGMDLVRLDEPGPIVPRRFDP